MADRLIGSIAQAMLAAAFLLGAATSAAQPIADRPLRLVVGFAPGGSADILARLIGAEADRQPGPAGRRREQARRRRHHRGRRRGRRRRRRHTLLLVTSGHAGSAALYPKLTYDPLTSFAPVAKVGASPVVIVAPAARRYGHLDDVIAAARKSPGKLNYAAGGGGATTTNLAAEFLKSERRRRHGHDPVQGLRPGADGAARRARSTSASTSRPAHCRTSSRASCAHWRSRRGPARP